MNYYREMEMCYSRWRCVVVDRATRSLFDLTITYQMNLILLTLLPLLLHAQPILTPHQLTKQHPALNIYRALVIQNNINFIDSHNAANNTFKLKAYPQFIGLTSEEMAAYYNAPLAEAPEIVDAAFKAIANQQNTTKPKGSYFVDLRKNNFNTSVKSQGWKCLNAYAYTVADLMDMLSIQANIGWGQISPQDLTDCSSNVSLSVNYMNYGCAGGTLNKSLSFAMNTGVNELAKYAINPDSVTNGLNQTCQRIRLGKRYKIKYIELPDNNPNSRASAIKNRRPVLAAIAAANKYFMFYQSGIINSCNNDNRLVHAVIIIGFSYNAQYGNYWILKNSWGTSWGEQGYARIQMGQSCGLMVKGYVASI